MNYPSKQKNPAQKNDYGHCKKLRYHHCTKSKDDEKNAFGKKQFPMRLQIIQHLLLHLFNFNIDVFYLVHGLPPEV